MKRFFLFLPLLFLAPFAQAGLEIGFVEIRDRNGNLVQLEPGGRFAHLAVAHDGKWLHTHPFYGVVLDEKGDLEKLGCLTTSIVLEAVPALESSLVTALLGTPFDRAFDWGDEELYCSELVAKLLGLEPEPMRFDPKLWPPQYQKLDGKPGLSPDKVFRKLVEAGHRPVATPTDCQ